jgi:hypothetical protein
MKKITLFICATLSLLCFSPALAQENTILQPYSTGIELPALHDVMLMPEHDFSKDIAYAEQFEKDGNYPLFAKHFTVNATMLTTGTWTELQDGSRIWRLKLKSSGALSMALFFDDIYIPEGALLSVYSPGYAESFTYDHSNNQGNKLFSTEFIKGDEQTLEYFEPAAVKGQGTLRLTELSHQYRSIAADACEVNIVCTPENTNWLDEKKGIVRIYVVGPGGAGYCTGSLVNNTALDCKRYILTALHCGVGSTTANFNAWVFRFNFEATLCTGQSDNFGTATNQFTGCIRRADSDDNGGDTGSDFLLVEITSTSTPTWWSGVYFNGWTRSATMAAGGVGIHHPAGSNKKISTFTMTPTSTSWGMANTHWRIIWVATPNGHGVTEGGSSGSPIFNNSGLIFGTLTGGSSFCTATSSPDAYGKMSYHWISNGSTPATQLSPWLDPTSSGVMSLAGAYTPCSATGIADIDQQQLQVYPNPSNGIFNVSGLNYYGDIRMRVISMLGQVILDQSLPFGKGDVVPFDISNAAEGLYFVEVQYGQKTVIGKISNTK